MYMYMLTSLLDQTTPPYMQGEHEEEWSGLRDYMLAFTSLSSESIALSALGGPYQRQCLRLVSTTWPTATPLRLPSAPSKVTGSPALPVRCISTAGRPPMSPGRLTMIHINTSQYVYVRLLCVPIHHPFDI